MRLESDSTEPCSDGEEGDRANRSAQADSCCPTNSEKTTCEEAASPKLSLRPLSWTRPLTSLAVLCILAYQKLLSPFLGSNCRFYPTCSQYTRLAIEKYGVVKGIWKGARRIGRCHPWHPGGEDWP